MTTSTKSQRTYDSGAAKQPLHIFHHTFGQGGGNESYALMLVRELRARRRQVFFHCRKADANLTDAEDVTLCYHPVASFPRKLRDFRFFRKISQTTPNLVGRQIALTRVPVADGIICGGTHRGYLRAARKFAGPFDWLQIHMEEEAYRSARRIISHSWLCTDELKQLYGVTPTKIVTLHPPVPSVFHPPENSEIRDRMRRKLGISTDKTVFLFPSTGHRRKGLGPVIEAMRAFAPHLILAVAGKPPRRFNVPFVQYLGYLNDMTPAYAAADFTILGSYYEPFGLVGIESVLTGTRLVFEQGAGCLEVVQSEAVIRFSVWQPDTIAGAIQSALELARSGNHRIADPHAALTYDPSVQAHVSRVLAALNEDDGSSPGSGPEA